MNEEKIKELTYKLMKTNKISFTPTNINKNISIVKNFFNDEKGYYIPFEKLTAIRWALIFGSRTYRFKTLKKCHRQYVLDSISELWDMNGE